jgi:signal transduction histidine kinase
VRILAGNALTGFRARHRIPFGLPEAVLSLLLLVIEFVLVSEPVTLASILCAVAGVALVLTAPRWPLASAVLTLPFVAASSYVAADAATYAVFFVLIIIEVVTASGLAAVGLALALVHTALVMVDFATMTVDSDPVVVTVTLVLLSTGYFVGRNRLAQALNNAALRRSLADSQRLQRIGLARELHDSVATSLTGVVMRSQALELTVGDRADPEVVEGLRDISRSSRQALEQLRTMLRLLSSDSADTGADSAGPPPSLRDSLETSTRELRAHGLRVRSHVSLPRASREPVVDLQALSRILTEMTANAAKHSPDHAEVWLSCRVNAGNSVTVSMVNPVSDSAGADPALTSDLGMGSMVARAHTAGGELVAGPVNRDHGSGGPQLWRTAVTLPIVGGDVSPPTSP